MMQTDYTTEAADTYRQSPPPRTDMARVSVFLILLTAGTAAAAQPATTSANTGVLVVMPAPRLGVDLPELERGAETFVPPPEPLGIHPVAGPRGDAALRGARTGFLVGASIGALITAAALAVDVSDGGGVSCEYICAWHLAAAGSVLFTAGTTAIGALVGVANASGRRPTNPPPRN